MSVGILIITHGQTGESLQDVAEFILGQSMRGLGNLSFRQSGSAATSGDDVRQLMTQVDQGDGVLILTDLLGASPCNLVTRVMQDFNAVAVTGVNLAMLVRVWNYRNRPLDELATIAAEGGRRGVEVVRK